ncbi:hypothetical protein ACFOX0_06445 [Micromonospora zhanjiangensis]|uniref:Uncharacterized protein n=1 Tax=Micromonospora zhanjiangensis TaxID=1522057 RepID=A0ABV8KHQ6_9ACTN
MTTPLPVALPPPCPSVVRRHRCRRQVPARLRPVTPPGAAI